MSESLILFSILAAAVSGVPGLLLSRKSNTGQALATFQAFVGGTVGLLGVVRFWSTGTSHPLLLAWSLPGADFHVAVDGLSAIFLVPIFVIPVLASIYGHGYWKQTDHPLDGRKLRLFQGTMTAGMALLVVARNSVLFLMGWEIMALSGFFLVTTEDHEPEVRKAGWIYLVATHVSTLCLLAFFALLKSASGSFTLAPLAAGSLTRGLATTLFILALVGFGLKAGIMPLHVWLPGAHANAPSHVSAVLSGVLIKMGVYGLLRTFWLLPDTPAAWGGVLLALGAVSGVLGIAFAAAQQDLKRLLAYCSIENMGIITMGIGLAVLGRALGHADWSVLGLGGALLHVWNHALFKALLFLSAGSVIHATRTRALDQLGGLARVMPWTALAFQVGAVAICGLPPLNGFASEFLLYLGLSATLGDGSGSLAGLALAVPALALIGALALACFVKAHGTVFLGNGRSRAAERRQESPPSMLGPMAALAACCLLIGLAPFLLVPLLGRGVAAWAPDLANASVQTLAPLRAIAILDLLLMAALALAGGLLWALLRRHGAARAATWGCGYVAPTARMQYTSSSFAQMIVVLFAWALRPRLETGPAVLSETSDKGLRAGALPQAMSASGAQPGDLLLFPRASHFRSEIPDAVLDEAVVPAFRFGTRLFSILRVFQQGNIQTYLLYIFIALVALLLWR
jgi:hydrogenase-4 component B